MQLPHGLGSESLAGGAVYTGEVFEDKREGVGLLACPDGRFFLGPWSLGLRHGRGFEGHARMTTRSRAAVAATGRLLRRPAGCCDGRQAD